MQPHSSAGEGILTTLPAESRVIPDSIPARRHSRGTLLPAKQNKLTAGWVDAQR